MLEALICCWLNRRQIFDQLNNTLHDLMCYHHNQRCNSCSSCNVLQCLHLLEVQIGSSNKLKLIFKLNKRILRTNLNFGILLLFNVVNGYDKISCVLTMQLSIKPEKLCLQLFVNLLHLLT